MKLVEVKRTRSKNGLVQCSKCEKIFELGEQAWRKTTTSTSYYCKKCAPFVRL